MKDFYAELVRMTTRTPGSFLVSVAIGVLYLGALWLFLYEAQFFINYSRCEYGCGGASSLNIIPRPDYYYSLGMHRRFWSLAIFPFFSAVIFGAVKISQNQRKAQ